jgi:hypothetical protein
MRKAPMQGHPLTTPESRRRWSVTVTRSQANLIAIMAQDAWCGKRAAGTGFVCYCVERIDFRRAN